MRFRIIRKIELIEVENHSVKLVIAKNSKQRHIPYKFSSLENDDIISNNKEDDNQQK